MGKKITIVGAGKVGSTACQLLAYKELGDIVLWNRTASRAKGIALDLMESGPIIGFDTKVIGTNDFKKTKGSEVVIIAAGVSRSKAGFTRDALLQTNKAIISKLVKQLVKYSPNAKYIVATNPLDAMVFVAKKAGRLKRKQVVGMAGVLDSARFRTFIAKELDVSVEDVTALVLGGHGDFMVPLTNHTLVNGVPLTLMMEKKTIAKLVERTKKGGAEIVKLMKTGSAFYAPGAALAEMAESILLDKKRILPCSAYLNGEYGIKGFFMGVPVKLGAKGVEEVIELPLNKEESSALRKSARKVEKLVNSLKVR